MKILLDLGLFCILCLFNFSISTRALSQTVENSAKSTKTESRSQPVLKVGVTSLEPWIFIEEKGTSGVYPEIAREVAKKLDLGIEFYTCPLKRCLFQLKKGAIDFYIGIAESSDRDEFLTYLKTPYRYSNHKVFYMVKDDSRDIKTKDDLKGLKIGIKFASNYENEIFDHPQIIKSVADTELQLLKMLELRSIDAFATSEDRGEFILSKYDFRKKLKKATLRIGHGEPRFPALAKQSKHYPNLENFEKAMKEIKDSGVLEKLYKTHYFSKLNIPESDFIKY